MQGSNRLYLLTSLGHFLCSDQAFYWFDHSGALFSTKAVMPNRGLTCYSEPWFISALDLPIFWSLLPNKPWKAFLS